MGSLTSPIAIVGMAAIFPQARTLREYWNNIVAKRDCITDVPASRWSVDDYYDPDPSAPDKTYSKRGGFIPDIEFDPMEFGLPPNSLEVTDVHQMLSLLVAKAALDDAGYGAGGRPFDRERTGVILGVGGGQKLITPLTARLQYPIWEKVLVSSGLTKEDAGRIVEKIKLAYVPWEENSFPGMLGNVIAGRIANRLDLGGPNCVVDAACASALSALRMALSDLSEGRSDVMLTGGVDTDNSPFMYLSFSKTPAFSKRDTVRPFDAGADGMLVGEGLGIVVLKRLADAERDSDRIYAVIRGMGAASDGRSKSIYAPRSEGQARAIRRAYQEAEVAPQTVGLIEAHGTGTVAGDLVEATTLVEVFGEDNPRRQHIALGSVKSQIGHTKSAAGVAGLIKAALALHHKVLPPTINVAQPHPAYKLEESALYVNTEPRPWVAAPGAPPRRAGVSAFGFGGTNFHVVLEEHETEPDGAYRMHDTVQPVLLWAETPAALLERVEQAAGALRNAVDGQIFAQLTSASVAPPADAARLGFVAATSAEALDLLGTAAATLQRHPGEAAWEHPRGIAYRDRALDLRGRVVALFPGQGSQYVDMGRVLAVNSPPVRRTFGAFDALFTADGAAPLSSVVYPPPAFDESGRAAQSAALQRTDYAQPAIGALSAACFEILRLIGFRPDFAAGHSFGELTALWAAGALDDADFFALARTRGKAMAPPAERSDFDAGAMLAVRASIAEVERVAARFAAAEDGVRVANVNAPSQVVLAGPRAAVVEVQRQLGAEGFAATLLPVAAAFHTPLVGHAQQPFAAALERVAFRTPAIPVYANATGQPYPTEPGAVGATLAEQLTQPVQFQREIESLYAADGFLFVECGPRNVLTRLVDEILGDRPHLAIALNPSRQKDDDRQFREAVVKLCVAGLPLDLADPYARRPVFAAPGQRRGGTVLLNGANYVGEKTRLAFKNALDDGFRISSPQGSPTMTHPEAQTVPPDERAPATPETTPAAAGPSAVHDAGHFERALEHVARQQNDALRAHQQFLENQAEYARTFFGLTQQQQTLLLGGGGHSLPAGVVEGLTRSMGLFHEQQAATARVHEQYLQQQTEAARSLFELLRGGAPAGTFPAGSAPSLPVPYAPPAAPLPLPAAMVSPSVPAAMVSASVPAAPAVRAPAAASGVAAVPVAAVPVATAVPAVAPSPPAPVLAPVVTPPAATLPAAGNAPDAVAAALLEVVSEKTGYPVETLELAMDLEADLGIDSIKRVEILGAMQERFPDAPVLRPEELGELHTLGQIVEYLAAQHPTAPAVNGHADSAIPPIAVNGAAHGPTPGTNGDGALAPPAPVPARVGPAAVPHAAVRLKSLPPPDALDGGLPAGFSCLVTDDGTATTAAVVEVLLGRGWPVAVLSLPAAIVPVRAPLPAGVACVALEEATEAALERALAASAARCGPIGAFIHLHRRAGEGDGLFPAPDEAAIRLVFLAAKHLQESLCTAAERDGAWFVTVTRQDGELGTGAPGGFGAIAGGLSGLTKTLRLEWERVFCRALDLDPAMAPERAAGVILAEMFDPDRSLTEVGHGPSGRVTLVAEPVGALV